MLKSLRSYVKSRDTGRPAVTQMAPRKLNENMYKTYINGQKNTEQLGNVIVLTVNNMH